MMAEIVQDYFASGDLARAGAAVASDAVKGNGSERCCSKIMTA
jgi:hypothetical protein